METFRLISKKTTSSSRIRMRLRNLEKVVSDAGKYPVRIDQDQYDELRADPDQFSNWTSETLERLTSERLSKWMDYADQRLEYSDIKCYVCPADNDSFIVDGVIRESNFVSNIDGLALKVDGGFELLGSGRSARKSFKGFSEDDLSTKMEATIDKLDD